MVSLQATPLLGNTGVSYDSTYDSEAQVDPPEDVETAHLLSDDLKETRSSDNSRGRCNLIYTIFCCSPAKANSSLKADSSLSRAFGYFDSCFFQTWHFVPVKTFLAALISTVATGLMYYSLDGIHKDLVGVIDILATQTNSETPAPLQASSFVGIKLAFACLPNIAVLLAFPGAIITHYKLSQTVKRDKTSWGGKWLLASNSEEL
ncbi:hypothetical protein CYMTET_28600 [Cymbomonas tetramitiformis]|uniref:Uncharacterized protein n=1 Tax=Cymbomonas tetramitiformis TaxID=36881 RepID=A0AAE0FMH6_9CHLO|nr:hypothetical protein CYMTET_28600 [Cymbomonas tetramitiformis]